MTRETKIGLLVGLAFIILFGIILSEKGTGRNPTGTTPMAALDPVVELVAPVEPQAPFRLVRNEPAVENRPAAPAAAEIGEAGQPSVEPTEVTVERTEPARPASAEPATETAQELSPALKKLLDSKPTRPMVQIPASNPPAEPATAEPVTVEVAQNTSEVAPVTVVQTIDPPAETAQAATIGTHTVESGETLAAICRKYYPGRAYRMLKVVMEVNGISKPEKLQVGETVKLPAAPPSAEAPVVVVRKEQPDQGERPVLVEVSGSPIGRASLDSASRAPAKAGSGGWYTVQSNDTLAKIARKIYGNEGAWHELYKANRDLIENPHLLQSGQKIRLLPTAIDGLAAGGTSAIE